LWPAPIPHPLHAPHPQSSVRLSHLVSHSLACPPVVRSLLIPLCSSYVVA
jgi:hypothetical protein